MHQILAKTVVYTRKLETLNTKNADEFLFVK